MHHRDPMLGDQLKCQINLKTAHDDLCTATHKRHNHRIADGVHMKERQVGELDIACLQLHRFSAIEA